LDRGRSWFENHYFCGLCGVYINNTSTNELKMSVDNRILHSECGRPIRRKGGRTSIKTIRRHGNDRRIPSIVFSRGEGHGVKKDILDNKEKWENIMQ